MERHHLQLIAGNGNKPLALQVAKLLRTTPVKATIEAFADGEIRVVLPQGLVEAAVYLIQPTATSHSIMELLVTLDALKRTGVARAIVVIPYLGYARQDRRCSLTEPLSSSLMARLMETAGADLVMAFDVHNPALEGNFRIPFIHVQSNSMFIECWEKNALDLDRMVFVAPDAGALKRVQSFCNQLGGSAFAVLAKARCGKDKVIVHVICGDVEGRPCMLVDDMISTGACLLKAAQQLVEAGAEEVFASVTHMVGNSALNRIEDSPIRRLFATDSLPLDSENHPKLEVVPVAPILATTIAAHDLAYSGQAQTARWRTHPFHFEGEARLPISAERMQPRSGHRVAMIPSCIPAKRNGDIH